MERGEQGRLRALGVRGAAPDHHRPHAGSLDQPSLERRDRPLLWVELLDVVHEVDAKRRVRARIERGEHAGFARRRNDLDALESGLARQSGHVLRALGVIQVLRGDRRQRDPLTQHPHRCIVPGRNLRDDRITPCRARARLEPLRASSDGHPHRARDRGLQKLASIDHVVFLFTRPAPVEPGEAGW
jgi:hypothetical protein